MYGGINILETFKWGVAQKRLGNTDPIPNNLSECVSNVHDPYVCTMHTCVQSYGIVRVSNLESANKLTAHLMASGNRRL